MEKVMFDAVKFGRVETIRILLSRGADINAQNADGNTLLHVAILKKNQEIIQFLLDSGANNMVQNNNFQTPADLATSIEPCKVQIAIINMLVKTQLTQFYSGPEEGYMALLGAVMSGNVENVKLLLSMGYSIHVQCPANGFTVLHCAAFNISSEDPSAMMEVLLSAGAVVNVVCMQGRAPLHFLTMLTPKSVSSIYKCIQLFANHGADFYIRDIFGVTPMDRAISINNVDAVKALVLIGGVDVNSKYTSELEFETITGCTILHEAFFNRNMKISKFLLENGADINALDDHNVSPLQCMIDSLNVVEEEEEDTIEGMKLLEYILLKWSPNVNNIADGGYNILHSFTNEFDLPDYLWKFILQYLVKQYVMQQPLNPSLLYTISTTPKYQIYFNECIQELELAKNNKLHSESWVTYLNLLVDNKKRLFQYAACINLMKNFTEVEVVQKFPVYGNLIYSKFSKAIAKRKVWDEAVKTLSNILPIAANPVHHHVIIVKILSFINFKDLQILCQ